MWLRLAFNSQRFSYLSLWNVRIMPIVPNWWWGFNPQVWSLLLHESPMKMLKLLALPGDTLGPIPSPRSEAVWIPWSFHWWQGLRVGAEEQPPEATSAHPVHSPGAPAPAERRQGHEKSSSAPKELDTSKKK